MLNSTYHPLRDKALAIFLLLAVVMGAYLLADRVYLSGLDQIKNEIEQKQRKSQKIVSILQKENEINAVIAQRQKSEKKQNIFLVSDKASTASSELQNKLKRLISTYSNAKILTIKPYPAVEHDRYMETSIEVRMRGVKHNELKNILYQVESGFPLLMINRLDIKRSQLRYKPIIKMDNRADKLEVILVVSGFFQGAEQ